MSVLGNILWFIFGGFLSGMSWIVAGCLWCISIIGIPVGLQCFKFAGLAFWPFGKEVIYGRRDSQPDCQYHLADRIGNSNGSRKCLAGVVCCITIIGIPFGKQFFKIAKLALMPFGAEVR